MAECVSTPNFLWKIENFASIRTKVSPGIWIGSLKWKVRYSRFWENSVAKVLLILDCESTLELQSTWQFRTEVSVARSDNSERFRPQIAKYNFENKEKWCLWNGTIPLIRSSIGEVNDVIFMVMISPIGDLEKLFKSQNCVAEVKPESFCGKSLIEDFRELFNNEESSDFVLKCVERSFSVHKAVLYARSKYFAAMFRSKMKENMEGTGEIKDMEPDILELVLRYMYTGEISELSMKSLQKVYVAADRFDVEALKVKCYSLFIHNVVCAKEDSGNGCEEEISTGNTENEMMEIDRIVEKKFLKELFMSNEWISFSQVFPHKAQEMCRPYLLQM